MSELLLGGKTQISEEWKYTINYYAEATNSKNNNCQWSEAE